MPDEVNVPNVCISQPAIPIERIAYGLALLLFLLYGLLLAYVVIRNQPIASPTFAVLIRTFNALIAGLLAGAIPGSLILSADVPLSSGVKLGIQATAGIAFAVLAFMFTPEVFPDTFPVKFEQPKVPLESQPSSEFAPVPSDGPAVPDQRLADQMQSWKVPFGTFSDNSAHKLVIIRSRFDRAYEPFRVRVCLHPDDPQQPLKSRWNEVFAMQPGLAFLVRQTDMIDRQLKFVVFIDGKGKNPDNNNLIELENVGSNQQLLLVVPFAAKKGKETEFNATDVNALVELLNLDYRGT